MKLSEEGLRLICSFEGYHERLPDGRCKAYQRVYNGKKDVPTIGYGCTEGVRMGMVWTEAEAQAALRKEIARFESAITRMVTVDLNQNEYDALVSLAYNVGEGALQKSTLLRKLNRGDRAGAAKEFHKWVNVNKRPVAGLVSRRIRESALFLKPVEAPDEPFMPQAVEQPAPVASATAVKAAGLMGLGGVTLPNLPSPPDMSAVTGWHGFGESVAGLTGWATQKPWVLGLVALWIGGMIFLPKIAERFGWQR